MYDRTSKADVDKAVDGVFRTGQCRVVPNAHFFNDILDIHGVNVDKVLEELTKNNVYGSKASRWTGFKQNSKVEKEYYGPLVTLANKIGEILNVNNANLMESSVLGLFQDYNNTAPRSANTEPAQIRPDCCQYAKPSEDLQVQIAQLQNELEVFYDIYEDLEEHMVKNTKKNIRDFMFSSRWPPDTTQENPANLETVKSDLNKV